MCSFPPYVLPLISVTTPRLFQSFSGLFPANLWARNPFQAAFSPLNIPKIWCPLHLQHVFSSFLSTSCTTRTLYRSRPLFAGMNSCCAKCVSQLHGFCVSISCTCCGKVLEPSHMASHVCQDDFHMSSCALSLRFSKHKSWPEPSSHARQPQTAQRKIWPSCQKIAIANWPSAALGGHLQWTSNRCLHHKELCWGCCLTTLATLTNHELTARVADKETLLNSVVAL